jgi:hypothetical protein
MTCYASHPLRAVWTGAVSCALLATGATAQNLADAPTRAVAANGSYVSWREHLIDDEALGGLPLRGADGLAMGDLDRDGHLDVVSVYESDDQYDGAPEGHVRIAFGSADASDWTLVTLAEGPEAGAAEDVAIGDVNGDGFPDIVVACELAHLIYFENPGRSARTARWDRLIPSSTRDRGSFIRVFLADLNGDGRPEVVTPNKGAQDPTRARQEPKEISFFELRGSPLADSAWTEHVLARVPWPINSQPVDFDGDGDVDILAGSVAERRMLFFENVGRERRFDFVEHRVGLVDADGEPVAAHGFNLEFADLSGDGRLDAITFAGGGLVSPQLVWIEQPETPSLPWRVHSIGTTAPDNIVGIVAADIDGNGSVDVLTGGYSGGSRITDEPNPAAALGRLAWFANHGPAGWTRHDVSRRQRGMFDKFIARDVDADGDVDFLGTRGNSGPYDGLFWLEQVRSAEPQPAFRRARAAESPEIALQ